MPRDKIGSESSYKRSPMPDGYVEESKPARGRASTPSYVPVALTLTLQDTLTLDADQGYDIKFSAGVMEGAGLEVHENGSQITVKNAGSYRFEVCGSATAYSDVTAKLIFYSATMADDIRPFAETSLYHTDMGYQLRGISTILPLEVGQVVSTRLVPETPESVIIHGGLRLMIYRVV